eukprot:gene15891-22023_t
MRLSWAHPLHDSRFGWLTALNVQATSELAYEADNLEWGWEGASSLVTAWSEIQETGEEGSKDIERSTSLLRLLPSHADEHDAEEFHEFLSALTFPSDLEQMCSAGIDADGWCDIHYDVHQQRLPAHANPDLAISYLQQLTALLGAPTDRHPALLALQAYWVDALAALRDWIKEQIKHVMHQLQQLLQPFRQLMLEPAVGTDQLGAREHQAGSRQPQLAAITNWGPGAPTPPKPDGSTHQGPAKDMHSQGDADVDAVTLPWVFDGAFHDKGDSNGHGDGDLHNTGDFHSHWGGEYHDPQGPSFSSPTMSWSSVGGAGLDSPDYKTRSGRALLSVWNPEGLTSMGGDRYVEEASDGSYTGGLVRGVVQGGSFDMETSVGGDRYVGGASDGSHTGGLVRDVAPRAGHGFVDEHDRSAAHVLLRGTIGGREEGGPEIGLASGPPQGGGGAKRSGRVGGSSRAVRQASQSNRYKLGTKFGQGHFGEVWRGYKSIAVPRTGEEAEGPFDFDMEESEDGTSEGYVLKRLFTERGPEVHLSGLREAYFGNLLKQYQHQDVVVQPHSPAQEGFYHLGRYMVTFEVPLGSGGDLWLVFGNEGSSLQGGRFVEAFEVPLGDGGDLWLVFENEGSSLHDFLYEALPFEPPPTSGTDNPDPDCDNTNCHLHDEADCPGGSRQHGEDGECVNHLCDEVVEEEERHAEVDGSGSERPPGEDSDIPSSATSAEGKKEEEEEQHAGFQGGDSGSERPPGEDSDIPSSATSAEGEEKKEEEQHAGFQSATFGEAEDEKEDEQQHAGFQVLGPSKKWRAMRQSPDGGAGTIRSLLRQSFLALDALHSLNITHRDVKPENLLIRRNDSAQFKGSKGGHRIQGGHASSEGPGSGPGPGGASSKGGHRRQGGHASSKGPGSGPGSGGASSKGGDGDRDGPVPPDSLHLRLIDFGSALDSHSLDSMYGEEGPSAAELTLEYAPPEALFGRYWEGIRVVKPRAWTYDIWSMGIVWLELVLGTPHVFQLSP